METTQVANPRYRRKPAVLAEAELQAQLQDWANTLWDLGGRLYAEGDQEWAVACLRQASEAQTRVLMLEVWDE